MFSVSSVVKGNGVDCLGRRYARLFRHCTQSHAEQEHIVQRRDDGQGEHRPDSDPLQHNDPKPACDFAQNGCAHRHDLCQRVGFSEDGRAEVAQRSGGIHQRAHHENNDVAAKDHRGDPPGNAVRRRKHYEQRAEQQLVGDGIEVLSEFGALAQRARQQAIESIADAGQHKEDERNAVMAVDNRADHKGNEAQAQQREEVGKTADLGEKANSFLLYKPSDTGA